MDSYEPGDSFYFIFPNPKEEVDFILSRSHFHRPVAMPSPRANVQFKAGPEWGGGGGAGVERGGGQALPGAPSQEGHAALPPHPLPRHPTQPRPRTLPPSPVLMSGGKGWAVQPFLRMVAEHTEEAGERRRLLELCSSQGSPEMVEFVKRPGLSPLDVLAAFPSAKPPLHRLIEHLPRLQPRPYTVASARPSHARRVRFAFSQVDVPAGDGRAFSRKGLATGFLLAQTPPAKVTWKTD